MQSCVKSRFTGFFAFVLLLSSCQPSTESEAERMQRASHEPAIAVSLASQRLATGEYDAALHWLRQAAVLGDKTALQHALQLQQREQGRLATAYWLQQQLDAGKLAETQVSAAQRAELGLWSKHEAAIAGYRHAQGCALTLQPIAGQQAGVSNWQKLQQQWQQDKQLSQLSVCFLPLQRINSITLACSEDSSSLVQCDYQALDKLVAGGGFSQLLVMAGRGKASYNNGILQLPDNASLALLRHEFMHILGFIDEYELAAASAAEVCQAGKIYPNLLLTEDAKAYQQHWSLSQQPELTAVDTCRAAGVQAYRVIAADNVMRFYELALPSLYFQLAQHILHQPEQLMPVQYYFAHLARQRQDWEQWQQFMLQASALGYADAQQALAP